MYISVQKLRPHAQIPKRATAQSAGYDLYALPEEPLTIQPHASYWNILHGNGDLPDNQIRNRNISNEQPYQCYDPDMSSADIGYVHVFVKCIVLYRGIYCGF